MMMMMMMVVVVVVLVVVVMLLLLLLMMMMLFYSYFSTREKIVKFLQSNPVQILLCVIVLLDAGVVIAQILLDLNSVKGTFKNTIKRTRLPQKRCSPATG